MTTNKRTSVTGGMLTKPQKSKSAAASALTQPPRSSMTVTAKSGLVISRTVKTHREALKRLADR
ncbi:hypothetical protein GGE09_004640 [Roseobacter sp. N2S]|nr:hypothetical protein [Roseobacter sp. N2S]